MALNNDRPAGRPRPDGARLGCGRDLDELWASIDQPPSAHERTCEECQRARGSLHHLAAVTASLRARDREDHDLHPSSRVKEAIMMVARAEVRRGRRARLATTALGTIDISEHALNGLVRFAASTLPGVRARRCGIGSIADGRSPTGTVDVNDLRITLAVALSATTAIPDTMSLLRERIGAVVLAQTSIAMRQIDVVVEDLYDA
ncbi:MAG: hypothetical protein ABWX68_08860 [Arthrobacter sp.]|uniref:hypothetical protein n=1 Tax=Arthrobacter sp. TaxID=1667 RepID=UPI00349A59AB